MPDQTHLTEQQMGLARPAHDAGLGLLVPLAANSMFPLTDAGAAWIVHSGDVLLFAVHEGGPDPGGPRHLVGSMTPGETVVGASVTDEGLALVAVGLTDATLRPAPVEARPDHRGTDLLRQAAPRIREHQAAQSSRVSQTLIRDDASLASSLQTLRSVLPQSRQGQWAPSSVPVLSSSQEPASRTDAVLALVLSALGSPPRPETAANALGPEATLGQLIRAAASASGFRAREVRAPYRWWDQDTGPLVGVLAAASTPVALLPDRDGMRLVDPVTGENQPITEEVAARLSPDVFVLSRSLTTTVQGVGQVLRLGLRGSRRDLVSLVALANVVGLASLTVPLATDIIFGQIVPGNERARLLAVVSGLALIAAGIAFGSTARSIAFLRIRTRFDSSAQPAVWDRLLTLPVQFFSRYSIGDLLTRVQGLDQTRQLLTDAVVATTLSGLFALYNLVLLFGYDSSLGMIGVSIALVQICLVTALALSQLKPARRELEAQSRAHGLVLELIKGAAKLRVAGAGTRAFGVWARAFAEQRRHAYRYSVWSSWTTVAATVWPTISILTLVVALGHLHGFPVNPGSFLAFSVAMTQVTAGVIAVGAGLSMVVLCIPYLELLQPVLSEPPEVDEARAAPGDLRGGIELSHVRLRYGPDGPVVLHDLSLTVQAGQFVALVGPSGAGKSSLLRLLLGFEAPESGTVSYDGKDLAGLDAAAVRRQIGTVLQSAQVIPGTVYSNIAGSTAMSRDEAWAAAESAGLADDIRAMPMGMETVVSEGASTLSGGQRQRLLIARALGHTPRVLLFDEATSALDNATQATVAQSVASLQITRVVIAHRLSTIQNADVIHVLSAGRVVQSGTYASLSAAPGPFRDLAARQLV